MCVVIGNGKYKIWNVTFSDVCGSLEPAEAKSLKLSLKNDSKIYKYKDLEHKIK